MTGIIAKGSAGFKRHVSGSLDAHSSLCSRSKGADETDDGVVIGEDADDVAVD
jgi:hypothetical protein